MQPGRGGSLTTERGERSGRVEDICRTHTQCIWWYVVKVEVNMYSR